MLKMAKEVRSITHSRLIRETKELEEEGRERGSLLRINTMSAKPNHGRMMEFCRMELFLRNITILDYIMKTAAETQCNT